MGSAILIFSADDDFAATLADQLQQELEIDCNTASDKTKIQAVSGKYSAIVSDEPLIQADYACPVVEIKQKPLHLGRLIDQVTFTLRQSQRPGRVELPAGHMLDCRKKELAHKVTGQKVNVTDKETQLFLALLDAGAEGMSKDELLNQVWGISEMIDTHTLETHIYRLRGKLKELSDSDQIIMVSDGRYKVIGDE